MTALVRVDKFHKSYGKTVAVNDLSFEVHAGQILGLVGANGAGKSSTLNALAGIIAPTKGNIEIDGHSMVTQPVQAKRHIGFVPDVPQLFDTMTVWEHLQFTAAAYRVADYHSYAEELLDWLELAPKRNAVCANLSRGMRQKVAVACAYLPNPKVYVFDEPLTGLDPHGIRTITDSFRQKAAENATVLVSSHLLHLVEDVCTHLLVLHTGNRCAFGPLREVIQSIESSDSGTTLEQAFFEVTRDASDTPSKV